MDGNKGLAGAGGEGEQDAVAAGGDLFERGTDRSILIVAPSTASGRVGCEEGFGLRGIQGEAHVGFVALAQCGGRGKLAHWLGRAGLAGGVVIFYKAMTVGAVDKEHIHAAGVGFALLDAIDRRGRFLLGLNDGHRVQLGMAGNLNLEQVVDAGLAMAVAAADLVDGASVALLADLVRGPAAALEGGIDELGSGFGFVSGHNRSLFVSKNRQ